MPAKKGKAEKGVYDIYPTLKIAEGKIMPGYGTFAKTLVNEKVIVIDGLCWGVF